MNETCIRITTCVAMFAAMSWNAFASDPPPTPSKVVKAYRTLNFGDSSKAVETKVEAITPNTNRYLLPNDDAYKESSVFWSSLVDGDAAYSRYAYQPNTRQTEQHELLAAYFGQPRMRVTCISDANENFSIACFILGRGDASSPENENLGLAIVSVSYKEVDKKALVEKFLEENPGAKTHKQMLRYAGTQLPGVYIECEQTIFSSETENTSSFLKIGPEKYDFVLTELSKLTAEDQSQWTELLKKTSDVKDIKELRDKFQKQLYEIAERSKQKNPKKKVLWLNGLHYLGWDNDREIAREVYLPAKFVIKSKSIIGYHMRKFIKETNDSEEKMKAERKTKKNDALKF